MDSFLRLGGSQGIKKFVKPEAEPEAWRGGTQPFVGSDLTSSFSASRECVPEPVYQRKFVFLRTRKLKSAPTEMPVAWEVVVASTGFSSARFSGFQDSSEKVERHCRVR